MLGHIDCPTCGTVKGMRITHDKNGDPFGFCEANCNQQMRVGGDKRRVRDFVARYPWAGAVSEPVTVTAPKEAAASVPVPVTEPEKPARKPVANPFDFLLQSGKASA